jgi:hypothetical protein
MRHQATVNRQSSIDNPTAATHELIIDIGGMPILVCTDSSEFARLLEDRYGGFVAPDTNDPVFELDIDLAPQGLINADEDVRVRRDSARWVMERGDFHAEWDPERRCGCVRQTANPYSIDAVLRILHSLLLARAGGFLVHAASAIRNGRAYLFAGVSGAGKTTISRLAPPDVTLLTDEISYVRPAVKTGNGKLETGVSDRIKLPGNRQSSIDNHQSYVAFGTPFAGELARIGENVQAPLAALYFLAQGAENRIEPVSESDALRELLRHILFFAEDSELVRMIFQSAASFVSRVPVSRLVFKPDAKVWELIT